MMNKNMGKLLIAIGIVLIIIGLIFYFGKGLPFGKLPGDITVKRENFSFHFPLVTSLIISAVLTLIFYLISKFR